MSSETRDLLDQLRQRVRALESEPEPKPEPEPAPTLGNAPTFGPLPLPPDLDPDPDPRPDAEPDPGHRRVRLPKLSVPMYQVLWLVEMAGRRGVSLDDAVAQVIDDLISRDAEEMLR
jgi:hypothetical protein